MTLRVLFENENLLVVYKPPNINMHQQGETAGIVEQLCDQLSIEHLYLCHRLDTPTSGCLLLAKNKQTAGKIGALFEQGLVTKYYLAISDKKPKKKQGKIAGDMLKARNGNYKLVNTKTNPAITHFKSIHHSTNKRLYICKPISGKTHQIRVALKAIGAVIIGDVRYKGSTSDRLYLHSYSLSFLLEDEAIHVRCLPTEGEWFSDDNIAALFNQHGFPENIL